LTQARDIAILGSGIMGSSAALALAACGARVTLFEAAERPFQGASWWNEGTSATFYLQIPPRSLVPAPCRWKPRSDPAIPILEPLKLRRHGPYAASAGYGRASR